MRLNLNKTVVNVLLILVTGGLLWYIMQPKNNISEKIKNSAQTKRRTEIAFTDKKYTINYKNFDVRFVENISLFNSEEKWLGSGFFDTDEYFEYPSSLNLAGGGGDKIIASKDTSLDLSKILTFDLVLNYKSNPNNLKKAELILSDTNGKNAVFVLPEPQVGWNVLEFPKEYFDSPDYFNWSKIIKLEFVFSSRPFTNIALNLGSLRGQPGNVLYNDWNVKDKRMLLLDKRNGEINLLGRNIGGTVATLKKVTGVTDFIFQGSYIPINPSAGGLFFRGSYEDGQGYYLTLNGTNSSGWQLYKLGKKGGEILAQGEIANFQFKQGEKYYLKVEVKKNNIKAFFSINGVIYTMLASVNDDEFSSGSVGIAVPSGVSLFNDFSFEQ